MPTDQPKSRFRAAIERMKAAARTMDDPDATTRALHDRIVDSGLHETAFKPFHRLQEVERLSRAGRSVADIATDLGISRRHVVHLRARLGVGRTR